jgi:hypothetical protein
MPTLVFFLQAGGLDMSIRLSCTSLALAVSIGVPIESLAGSCSLVADVGSGAASVQVGGKAEALSGPKTLGDCSNIVAQAGAVVAVYEVKGDREVTLCALNQPCAIDPASKASLLDDLDRQAQSAGGNKLDKDFARVAGLPYGRILDAKNVTTISFANVGSEVKSFSLVDGAGRELQRAEGGTSIDVPSGSLKPGKYLWKIVTAKGQHEGRILTDKERNEIVRELDEARKKSGANSFQAKVAELGVLFDNGLSYEVAQLRRDLKL